MASHKAKGTQRPSRTPHISRADRREADRALARERQQRRRAHSGPSPFLIGGAVTAVILAGIIAYAIFRTQATAGTATPSTGPALTVASDLSPSSASMLSVGSTAPSFTLKDIFGQTYSLQSQRGRPLLLEFFAVWCPHCQREAPIIQKLSQKYGSKGLATWSVLANPYGPNYDSSLGQDTTLATRADLVSFSKLYGEHVPQLVDPHFATVNRYGVNGYPSIYIVDKGGKIVYANSGDQPQSQLEKAITTAFTGK